MSFKKIKKAADYVFPKVSLQGIVLHWTAGTYGAFFSDYHFIVDELGNVWQNDDALPGTTLPHCWHRNTGRIGIAAAAMYGATENDYGKYPVTRHQIEAIAALAARLMMTYGIPIEEVKTHAEWATIDGYGPGSGDPETRWDFWHEGETLKKKILWYLKQMSPAPKK